MNLSLRSLGLIFWYACVKQGAKIRKRGKNKNLDTEHAEVALDQRLALYDPFGVDVLLNFDITWYLDQRDTLLKLWESGHDVQHSP